MDYFELNVLRSRFISNEEAMEAAFGEEPSMHGACFLSN